MSLVAITGFLTGVQAYLQSFPPGWSYVIIFLLLIVNAPEDPLLLAAGYFTALDVFDFGPLLAVVIAGIVIGDTLVFLLGRTGRPLIQKLLTPERFARVKKLFDKHHDHAAFFTRFTMGARFWAQLAAGAMHMPLGKFVFYDTLGALVWAPFILLIGHFFGGNLTKLLFILKRAEFLITIGVIVIVVLFIIRIERKEIKEHPERRLRVKK